MAEFTIGERLLLHLYTYRSVDPNDYYNIPWDLTQDGISTSLRISRAHASIELKKQKEKGNVIETLVRIQGGKVRRMAYSLNNNGLKAAIMIEEKAKKAGVDIKTLLDMKKQDPAEVLEGLPNGDRFALGVACAFRLSVPLDVLPPHERSVIPADVTNRTTIVQELRVKLFSAADPDEIREWHNFIANYYDSTGQHSVIPNEDDRALEMAYHLFKAGRVIDGCKVVSAKLFDLMYIDDREFFETVKSIPLDSIRPKYKSDFLMLLAELALSQRDLKTARETAEVMTGTEGLEEYGYACLAECLIMRNMKNEAIETIDMINGSGNVLGMLKLAEVYLDLDDADNAEAQMNRASGLLSENNLAAGVQRHMLMARIHAARGEMQDAARHLSKAFESADDTGKKHVKSLKKRLGL